MCQKIDLRDPKMRKACLVVSSLLILTIIVMIALLVGPWTDNHSNDGPDADSEIVMFPDISSGQDSGPGRDLFEEYAESSYRSFDRRSSESAASFAEKMFNERSVDTEDIRVSRNAARSAGDVDPERDAFAFRDGFQLYHVTSDGTAIMVEELESGRLAELVWRGFVILVYAVLVLLAALVMGLLFRALGYVYRSIADAVVKSVRHTRGLVQERTEEADAISELQTAISDMKGTLHSTFVEIQNVKHHLYAVRGDLKELTDGPSGQLVGHAVHEDDAVPSVARADEEFKDVGPVFSPWEYFPFTDESMPWNESVHPAYSLPSFDGYLRSKFVSVDGKFILVGDTPTSPEFAKTFLSRLNLEISFEDFLDKGGIYSSDGFDFYKYGFDINGVSFYLMGPCESNFDGKSLMLMDNIQSRFKPSSDGQ